MIAAESRAGGEGSARSAARLRLGAFFRGSKVDRVSVAFEKRDVRS